MKKIIRTLKYIRWNLKWIRYFGKIYRKFIKLMSPQTQIVPTGINYNGSSLKISKYGWDKLFYPEAGFSLDKRHHGLESKETSFINISDLYLKEVNDCVTQILTLPSVCNIIKDYFKEDNPWLWTVGLNLSTPKEGLSDSQFWHFDYGDKKQLHLLYYVTEVTDKSGPFSFFPKSLSSTVNRNPVFIERLTDEDLMSKYSIDANEKEQLIGKPGDLFFTDPGMLIHQGARCEEERIVLFITITTSTPYDLGGKSTMNSEARNILYREYQRKLGEQDSSSSTFTEQFFF